MSSTPSSIALLVCFLAVTSKGPEGHMFIAQDSIATIEAVSNACNYGVAVNLKNGQKICVLDSMEKVGRSLAASEKRCEGNR